MSVRSILARGDRRLAPVLLETRGTSVRDFFDALARHGLDAAEFLAERAPDTVLPWHVVAGGVKPSFIAREYALAQRGQAGYRCPPRAATCTVCGACAENTFITKTERI